MSTGRIVGVGGGGDGEDQEDDADAAAESAPPYFSSRRDAATIAVFLRTGSVGWSPWCGWRAVRPFCGGAGNGITGPHAVPYGTETTGAVLVRFDERAHG